MPEPAGLPAQTWAVHARRLARTANPYLVDAGVATLVMVALSAPFVLPRAADAPPATWQGFLLAAGTALPLVWRRRAPLATLLVVTPLTVAAVLYARPGQPLQYGLAVAVYTVAAAAAPRWQRRTVLTLWPAGILVTQWLAGAIAISTAFTLLTFFSAYALGLLTRVRQAYTAAVEDRARRLEHERAIEVASAAARERERIARDMHDILAHAVSLMVVQAEAGPVVVRTDPDRAEAAFEAIAAAGRDAMAQLRRMLGLLEESGGTGPRTPQPTFAGLPDLVEQVGRTGLRVELAAAGEPRPLRPDVEVAAYRVVQEALTNTVKHAGATTATVRVVWGHDTLGITVADDGRGRAAPAGRGHGLIGIRERAAACGGNAAAGPGPGGCGFVVTVRLPVTDDGLTRDAEGVAG